jgi:hypothetical protein
LYRGHPLAATILKQAAEATSEEQRLRGARALRILDPGTPCDSEATHQFLEAVRDVAREWLLGTDRNERERLGGLLSAVLTEAERIRAERAA